MPGRSVLAKNRGRPWAPGRGQDALRPRLPQAAAVRQSLRDQHQVLVVMAEGGRAGEQAHIGWRTERAETGLEPVVPAGAQQPAAELGLLIDQDHPAPGLTRLEGCGDS